MAHVTIECAAHKRDCAANCIHKWNWVLENEPWHDDGNSNLQPECPKCDQINKIIIGELVPYDFPLTFLNYERESYLNQPLTTTPTQNFTAYRTSKHRITIETSRWSTIPISGDSRLCQLCCNNVVENEHTLC